MSDSPNHALQRTAPRVTLAAAQSGQRTQTSHFVNTDTARGRAPGCIGIQAYPDSTVAWRHIRIKA